MRTTQGCVYTQHTFFSYTVKGVNFVSLLSPQTRRQEAPMNRLVMFSCQIAEGMEYLVRIVANMIYWPTLHTVWGGITHKMMQL